MTRKLKDEIIEYLKANSISKNVVVNRKVKKEVTELDENIGKNSNGIYYDKRKVLAYLKENMYEINEQNIDIAAKICSLTDEEVANMSFQKKIVEKNEKALLIDAELLDDEDLSDYLGFMILKQLVALRNVGTYHKQYMVEVVSDSRNGHTDVSQLQTTLNKYANQGWILKSCFTNEVGHNENSIGYGGFVAGTNSTVDQIVLIFEKDVV